MKLHDEYPHGILTHSTSREHFQKHENDPRVINGIRQEVYGDRVDSWDISAVHEIMRNAGVQGELINASDNTENGVEFIVGGALITYLDDQNAPYGRHAYVDASDVVVADGMQKSGEPYRGRGLGLNMIARGLQSQFYGKVIQYPDELTITDRNGILNGSAKTKIQHLGFNRENRSPTFKMLLAGKHLGRVVGDDQYKLAMDMITQSGINGYILYLSDRESQEVFKVMRNGVEIGSVRSAQGSKGVDYDKEGRVIKLWDYYDITGELVVKAEPGSTNEYFAVSDFVNRTLNSV